MEHRPRGRDKRTSGREYLALRVDLMCPRRHQIGQAWRHLDSDLPDGWSRLTWTDTDAGGRVEGRCEKCGADCRLRWSRVTAMFDELLADGRHAGKLTG